jgi:hypothetical protein
VHIGRNDEKIGNIIIDQYGRQNPLDDHDNFEQRIDNYIVGRDPIVLVPPREIVRGRLETLDVLKRVLRKDGASPINVMDPRSRLDEDQIEEIRRVLSVLGH